MFVLSNKMFCIVLSSIKAILEYSLTPCTGSYASPCPLMDPKDVEKFANGKLTTEPIVAQIDFNVCEDKDNCK